MDFKEITLTLNSVPVVFKPYEITSSGAYIWVEEGVRSFKALRFVITPNPSRDGKVLDRVSISIHKPKVATCDTGCGSSEEIQYSELLKVDAKFHPETSGQTDRVVAYDALAALIGDAGVRALFESGAIVVR